MSPVCTETGVFLEGDAREPREGYVYVSSDLLRDGDGAELRGREYLRRLREIAVRHGAAAVAALPPKK